ncbi:prolipoprotein diacylglyceryl transferase [Candidatus Woesearchaeota archaeon]|jgi:phosphatidylglycerol---prolipoprotein diacylglyceryl transferase|nr:prolipoprotein diacylglyceryl transferase [Candidatus Woesearchaeota archaeon]
MFIIDFNPIIVSIGTMQIRWYGIIYILGFVFAYFWLNYVGKKWVKQFDKENVEEFILYLMIGIIAGSRLFEMIFYRFESFIANPLELFKIWEGGMSFHGGLIGTFLAVKIWSVRRRIEFWKILDLISPVAIFSLMLGRIGNLLNGELIGTPFNGPWCAIFSGVDNVCRHPYPIYAFISHLLLFSWLIFLIYLNRSTLKKFFGSKLLSINFLIGYGILRIITDIWKIDNIVLGLKTGQLLSVIMIIIGLGIFAWTKKKWILNKITSEHKK